jgi:hypothetical protein
MKRFSWFMGAMVMLGLTALPALKADPWDRKTVITISQPLEVPGVVLPAGTYVMKLLDSSSNRHIVQIMNEKQNHQLALTMAIPAERLRPTDKTVLTMYEGSQGAPPALRTWFYPGDTVGQEFLYARRQAVRISERTNATVPEIETAKPATVAATEPAHGEESRDEAALIARAEPAPAPIAAPEPIATPEPQQTAVEPQSSPENSSQTRSSDEVTTASDSLPKTAGNGPLAGLIGGLSLAAAFGMMKKAKPDRTL